MLVHHGIHRLRLDKLLPVIVTLDDVPRAKPASDAYLEAARRLGADPARCLAVDDSDDGIAAAQAEAFTALPVLGRLPGATHL
ncbi:HAD superfamily hydrolase (TIGR01509 family) [Kitasatospora sp. MAP12-15]|uniref:HAD-IA family hydrolase n=1 Tax=unclassified Kitasatospora TaxID=2633591 RepID=UPI002472FCA5|nr:HAD-IA family hydrolase [Kitasatospora sp. MAP12-44]MDH6115515.1 HAD superfamily hydrolase (TIGR01509 family) [Kitasatospora sp. MAP12-44]